MSLLLLTLASDPYDRPGHFEALASALRGGRGSSTELAPPDTVVVLDEAFIVPGASPRIPVLRCRNF
jgi:hypothetical protein